ncbi:replication protein [Salinicola sp. DM10]|uniref:replication protein n=1 Tax=Salinicola sp. DM10 TaxID=2815721 RepID=UPI001A8F4A9E|nr:replication protein [Salinicola sp. DM10]
MEDGYTRIANELLELVMAAPFTLREMRVVLAVIRFTYGWNRKQARVTGGILAELTGMPATKASQTLAALVAKNVIHRHGGSRAAVSLNKRADEWQVAETSRKTPPPRQAKAPESYQTGDPDPKRYDSYQNGKSESYQNGNASKDMKDKPPLPSVEGEGQPPEKPAKPPARKSQPALDLTALPSSVSREAIEGFIDHRRALKKPLTQRALVLNVNEAIRAAERIPDLTPDQALDETVLAGWQGVKADWLERRLAQQQRQGGPMNAAERLHAQNQEAIRRAVEARASAGPIDDLLDQGGHW